MFEYRDEQGADGVLRSLLKLVVLIFLENREYALELLDGHMVELERGEKYRVLTPIDSETLLKYIHIHIRY